MKKKIHHYSSHIEKKLDELRDKMWQESGCDFQRAIEMIKKRADQALRGHGFHYEPVAPNVDRIVKD